ncbi:MAG: hypothetical protein LBJ61_08415 [Deltaproteobacteria bacterium]|nr:hypothetical protein [Deltaproteobacteria bacterium]
MKDKENFKNVFNELDTNTSDRFDLNSKAAAMNLESPKRFVRRDAEVDGDSMPRDYGQFDDPDDDNDDGNYNYGDWPRRRRPANLRTDNRPAA